jgi:hypothetical protein
MPNYIREYLPAEFVFPGNGVGIESGSLRRRSPTVSAWRCTMCIDAVGVRIGPDMHHPRSTAGELWYVIFGTIGIRIDQTVFPPCVPPRKSHVSMPWNALISVLFVTLIDCWRGSNSVAVPGGDKHDPDRTPPFVIYENRSRAIGGENRIVADERRVEPM